MHDVEPRMDTEPSADAPQVEPLAAPRQAGMFQDPVVRKMTYVVFGLVILFLATVAGALITGEFAENGPRTAAERQLLIAAAAAKTPGAKGEAWAPYVDALVATGDLRGARIALDRGRASVVSTLTPGLDLAEARLLRAQKRYDRAAEMAEKAMKGYAAQRAARIEAAGTEVTPEQMLFVEDYYNAALVKAYAYVDLRRWKDAVGMFDLYIAKHSTAADILIDRANAKIEMKDNAGAEKDFREALRFVPYDKEAKAGLKRIGATQ